MSNNDEPKLIVDVDGPVTTLTLNRPQTHNALDIELSALLNAEVRRLRSDRTCRVVVVRGAGGTFCAGDDLKEFRTWSEEDPFWQIPKYQETAQILQDLPAITIARVDGVCAGGGLELTLVCDFVVATDRSRWGMPEIDWEITPGWGGTSRLPRFAGRRKAKEWNLLGAMFDGATAERYNLVNRLTAPDKLDAEVQALIEVILAKDVRTLWRTKKYLNLAPELHISGALAFETELLPRPLTDALDDFAVPEKRKERRKLAEHFWQD
jgi:enoyl-CoA hydratase